MVVEAGDRANIDVVACGEMSGEPIYTLLLIGMGLRRLSATPHNIPEIKKLIRSISLADAVQVARKRSGMRQPAMCLSFLREQAPACPRNRPMTRFRAVVPVRSEDAAGLLPLMTWLAGGCPASG